MLNCAYIDRLLTKNATDTLTKLGLKTSVPPKIRAQRAIICRQIDSFVGERGDREIADEIERCNTGLRISLVIKFGTHTHVFKVEFENTQMAERVVANGMLCFNVKISPTHIQREEYHDIQVCFNCYELDDHIQLHCKQPRQDRCSECTGDHNYRVCNSEIKKCLNCGGSHRTLAMSCPERKHIIKQRKEEKARVEREERPW